VLSVCSWRDPEDGEATPDYDYLQGTSMAAPHVAGVVSLMEAVYPDLTPGELDGIMASGSMSVDLGSAGRDDEFGVGRIDAYKAVLAAAELASGISPGEMPAIGVSSTRLNFGRTFSRADVSVFNAGTGALQVASVEASDLFLSVEPPSSADGLGVYTISIDRSGLATGIYRGSVVFESDAGEYQERQREMHRIEATVCLSLAWRAMAWMSRSIEERERKKPLSRNRHHFP